MDQVVVETVIRRLETVVRRLEWVVVRVRAVVVESTYRGGMPRTSRSLHRIPQPRSPVRRCPRIRSSPQIS